VYRESALLEALIAVGVPVAGGPPEITRMLVQHTVQKPQLLCPAFLREHIRAAARSVLAVCSAEKRHAAVLLAYCLQDLDETDAESCLELAGACNPCKTIAVMYGPKLLLEKNNCRYPSASG